MSAHTCAELTEGCYRCELNRDEIEAIQQEVAEEAQAAWLAYRDEYSRQHYIGAATVAHRLRRREFIAGYEAASFR